MAYDHLDEAVPDAATQSVAQMGTSTRLNVQAMRDAVLSGALYGWNYSITAGTGDAEQPQYVFYKNGTKWLRHTMTYGTTGGEDGNVTVMLVEYSSNSGSAYDTVGTLTYTFDADGNCTAANWS